MDRCLGGTSRRPGWPLPLKAWSNTVNGFLKADRVGAMEGATKRRATRMKEAGN